MLDSHKDILLRKFSRKKFSATFLIPDELDIIRKNIY